MKKILSILFVLLCQFVFSQIPSTEWIKCIGGSYEDGTFSKNCIQSNDSCYVILGSSESNNGDMMGTNGGSDIVLTKIDQQGNIVWLRNFGGSSAEEEGSLIKTTDGGYLIIGTTISNDYDISGNHGFRDIWVVKVNSSGIIQWQKCFGGSGDDNGRSIKQTSDGGFILIGYTSSNDYDVSGNHGFHDIWVVKLSNIGLIQWQKCFGGSGDDYGDQLIESSDGNYYVGGVTHSYDGDGNGNHGVYDIFVAKLSSLGLVEWQKCLGSSETESFGSILMSSDGSIIIGGTSGINNGDVTTNYGGTDGWMIKLNSTGIIQWQKCFGGSGNDNISNLIETSDGGFVLLGGISANRITKISNLGIIEWQKNISSSSHSLISIIQTSDGGYFAAGSTTSYNNEFINNHGGADIIAVKLNVTTCENYIVTSNTNPTLTVNYGETVTLPAITTNSTNQSTTFSWGYLYSPFTLNPSNFSGINPNQLTITNVVGSMDNNQNTFVGYIDYGNGCGDTVFYNIDICTGISSQPANLSVATGNDAAFHVTVNDPSATYQWYSNFGILSNTGQYSGTNTDSLVVSNVNISNDNQYFYCIISSQCDNLQYSDTAWLNGTQNVPCEGNHIINNNTYYLTTTVGNDISYSIITDSSELTFQWYANNTPLNNGSNYWGVNTNQLYINNFGFSYPNSYYCIITDNNNCKDTFYLYVNINSACSGYLIYDDHYRETTILPGSSVSIDVGHYYAYSPTDTTIGFIPAFQWYSDNGWGWTPLTDGSDYNGVNNDTMSIHNLNNSSINFYYCVVTNTVNNCQDTIHWTVHVCDTLTQPYDIDTVYGATVQFIVHINDSSATFQWYSDQGFGFHSLSDAGQYTGAKNDTLTITDICTVNNHQIFYCVVHSQCYWHTDTVVLTIGNTNSLNMMQGMKSVNFFPNPVTSILHIELNEDYIGRIYHISDNLGRIVKSGTFYTGKEQVNIEQFENGIYFLNILEVDGSIKIIKN